MSNELILTGVSDGWTKVDLPDGSTEYVSHVKIAGAELGLDTMAEATITCGAYSFERDYHPALLIEAPEWYNPLEDSELKNAKERWAEE